MKMKINQATALLVGVYTGKSDELEKKEDLGLGFFGPK